MSGAVPYGYRHDPAVPTFSDDGPIVVFDGHCALCSGWAHFILRRDRRARFRLLPAQTMLGRALYDHYGLATDDYETNILIQDGVAWFRSEACIRMLEGLGFPWRLAGALRLIPLRLRDAVYGALARRRQWFFSRREMCDLAAPHGQARILRDRLESSS